MLVESIYNQGLTVYESQWHEIGVFLNYNSLKRINNQLDI